jgi:hypothetical protein
VTYDEYKTAQMYVGAYLVSYISSLLSTENALPDWAKPTLQAQVDSWYANKSALDKPKVKHDH